IITGQRALDTGASQIGPRLAEALGLAQVCDVREFSVADGKVMAKRPWGGSYVEVEAPLPAVLAIAPAVNKPRYPHGARIMNAYREWEVTTWGIADLGLAEEDLAPITEFRGRTFPPPREFGERITGAPEEAARELVHYLKSRKVI
ncbi:MAG: electron transfer flavoprotein subunit beta/FixA family protein, partial [Candidatus Tectimicrobiota bacterium]